MVIKNWIKWLKKMWRKIRDRYKEYKISKKQSHLDGMVDRVLFGWVISKKEPIFEVYVNKDKLNLSEKATSIFPVPEIHPEAYRFGINLRDFADIKEGDEILVVINGKKVKSTPLTISKSLCFGKIEQFVGYECIGWAGTALGDTPSLKVIIDNQPHEVNFQWFIRENFKRLSIYTPTGFKFKIPPAYLDGKPHTISIMNSHNNKLLHKEKIFRFYIKNFYIDHADENAIAGWIQIGDYPGPLDLDIFINNKKVGSVQTDFIREDAERVYGKGCYGFYYSLSEEDKSLLYNSYIFSIFIKDTNIKVIDSHKAVSTLDILEGLEKVAQSLREKGDKILLPYLKTSIDLIRANINKNINRVIYRDVENIVDKVYIEDIVDVIIPVYKGKKQTLECIESVLKAKTEVAYEIIVINDCTPEQDLRQELIRLAEEGKITLIENEENLGFVKSVNIGMKLHKNRDVVLLNSDTLVPDYWLDRLKKAAYSSKNIGTVSPLSNRATILSIPKPNYDNDIPSGFDYKKIDSICRKVNEVITIDIPTAIGFCMYIKRECLNEVGYFDEEKFDKGYGEENDFCLRASSLGWRHVACLDLFVEHHGSLSFGDEKPQRVKKALEVINRLYPEYNIRIQRFIKRDPIAPYRNRIIKEIFKEKYKTFVLSFIHNWGGGSLKYCKDIAQLLAKEGLGTLFIHPEGYKINIFLYYIEDDKENSITLQFPDYLPTDELIVELKDLPIKFVHYNQTIGFKDLSIWKIPKILNVPYFVTIHDYYYICPRVYLMNSGNIFCGLPDEAICEVCLNSAPLEKDIEVLFKNKFDYSISKWRDFYRSVLMDAKRVFAPTETAKNNINMIFNLENIKLVPHPEKKLEVEIKKPDKVQNLRIAIIGAIGEHKGYTHYLKLIDYSHKNNLPFEFVFFGYTKNNKNLKKYSKVTITGPYKDEKELYNLVKAYSPNVALFLHVWPETYTYTLSESLRFGLYPVVYDIGAPAERIKNLGVGTLIPFPSPPEKIAHILLELLEKGWETRSFFIGNECNIKDVFEV